VIRYHRKGHAHADRAAGHVVISYLAALLAAVTNATSNALNRKAARDAPGLARLRLRLIADLLHRRAWLATALISSPRLQALQAEGTHGAGERAKVASRQ